LSRQLVEHRFDLRHLIRLIMNSRTYQLASTTNSTNVDDEINYSHVAPRPLAAEQLLDSLHQATDTATHFRGFPAGVRATELPTWRADRSRGVERTSDEQFLIKFGKPPRLLSCECERSNDATLGQTFQLVSGPIMNSLLTEGDNRLGKALASGQNDEQLIDELYWSALSRKPTTAETQAMLAHLQRAASRRRGLEDVLWSLLNSKEFLLRP
jgi:hypothetical protein